MTDASTLLKQTFGYDTFRHGQKEAVDALMAGRDVIAVMPTGAGKSICFQIPALAMEGITLVISPLISLMQDQVRTLISLGVPAAYFNRSLSAAQYRKALANFRASRYKIVYVAPERLEMPGFLAACQQVDISMIAVDEAHCISQWGQEFRPPYARIPEFTARLPRRPVMAAFTATATPKVRLDIIQKLGLRNPVFIHTSFDRPNLHFSVLRPKDRRQTLATLLKDRAGTSTIIYCASRKACEEVSEYLNGKDIPCQPYHAGMDNTRRQQIQDDFIFDRLPVIAATNAFGMGIDKPDVRTVIHYQMPASLEAYYQEAGRAGRDGLDAQCILLYAPKDIRLQTFLIENGTEESDADPDVRELRIQRDKNRLSAMIRYATSTSCLTRQILAYFGENLEKDCRHCSNCLNPPQKVDATEQALKVFASVLRTGQHYGTKKLTDIMKGANTEFIRSNGLKDSPAYGCLKGYGAIDSLLDQLVEQNYLELEGDYPKLILSQKAVMAIKSHEPIFITRTNEMVEKQAPADSALLAALKKLRLKLARTWHVPPYVIFSDATLAEMAEKKPRSFAEMLEVGGVGPVKLEKYGDDFLELIARSTDPSNEGGL